MRLALTLAATVSVVSQIAAGQLRAQLWKLQDARGRRLA
jgi:hypothetical protein